MPRTSSNPHTLTNAYGMVRPYTRHLSGCKIKKKKNDESCSCPKWLYEHRKGSQPRRYTLTTPSWSEALKIATDTLEGFNPTIAAAKAVISDSNAKLVSVADACQKWIKRTKSQNLSAGILAQYKSLSKKLQEWADKNRVEYIQDITRSQLESWYGSDEWTKYAVTTRHQRWSVLRSMFSYWHDLGDLEKNPIAAIKPVEQNGDFRQGPYTDEQIKAIFNILAANTPDIPDITPNNIPVAEKRVYTVRLHAFVTLLLDTGCDVVDAVLFEKTNVTLQTVNSRKVSVYRYHREKTGKPAVIPLSNNVTKILTNVPMLKTNPENMPFRHDGELEADIKTWSYRVRQLLSVAKVHFVTLPRGRDGKTRKKAANVKQFRHTFAIRQLVAGQREETVARMLGHSDVQMIRSHYGAWVKERDDAHVREVIEVRAGL